MVACLIHVTKLSAQSSFQNDMIVAPKHLNKQFGFAKAALVAGTGLLVSSPIHLKSIASLVWLGFEAPHPQQYKLQSLEWESQNLQHILGLES